MYEKSTNQSTTEQGGTMRGGKNPDAVLFMDATGINIA